MFGLEVSVPKVLKRCYDIEVPYIKVPDIEVPEKPDIEVPATLRSNRGPC